MLCYVVPKYITKNVAETKQLSLKVSQSLCFFGGEISLWPFLHRKRCLIWWFIEDPHKECMYLYLSSKIFLVGGFNPVEKYARQIGSFPQFSGWKKHVWVATETSICICKIWWSSFKELIFFVPFSTIETKHFHPTWTNAPQESEVVMAACHFLENVGVKTWMSRDVGS